MSVSSPTFPSGKTKKEPAENPALFSIIKTELMSWINVFRHISFAIILLSLLAIAVLAGVLIPQEGLVDTVDIKAQVGGNYQMMKAAGLFNVYSAPWFITIEVLFFFSLLFGSFQWLKPAYLAATRRVFCAPEHIRVSPNHTALKTNYSPKQALALTANALKKSRYRIFWNEDKSKLYASKGDFSRFGPVVAHFGILLMLVASVTGAFTGFKAQELAIPGDTFKLTETEYFMPNMPESYWQGSVPDWQVRVNDFNIDYYAETPDVTKQFYADISLLDNTGKEIKTETISVNHPMSHEDLTIYQASFKPTGKLWVRLNGEKQKIEVNTQFQDRPVAMVDLGDNKTLIAFPFFVQQDEGVNENYLVAFIKTAEGFMGQKTQDGSPKMPDNVRLTTGQAGKLGDIDLEFIKPEYSTGLQIKKAPEVPFMYLSYIIIMLGTVMCIFSQRRIWATVDAKTNEVLIHFKTNKARISFMKELKKLHTQLKTALVADNPNTETA